MKRGWRMFRRVNKAALLLVLASTTPCNLYQRLFLDFFGGYTQELSANSYATGRSCAVYYTRSGLWEA
eukprot:515768-Rhodomonas_salina.2